MLDVPKLLDLAALYCPTHPDLTRQLITSLFQLQPQYESDVTGLVGPLVTHLTELTDRGTAAARKAVRGGTDAAAVTAGLVSMCDFMRDTVASVSALVAAYPRAAALLLAPGPGSLLTALATLHDRLLPLLAKALVGSSTGSSSSAGSSGGRSGSSRQAVSQLGVGLVGLGAALLRAAYLSPALQAGSGPSSSSTSSAKARTDPVRVSAKGAVIWVAARSGVHFKLQTPSTSLVQDHNAGSV